MQIFQRLDDIIPYQIEPRSGNDNKEIKGKIKLIFLKTQIFDN